MKGNQWPLVIFTVLIQLSVGLYIISGVPLYLIGDQFFEIQTNLFAKIDLLSVVLLSLIGMTSSLLHLGTPKNAIRTLSNLSSSWLSAEILFTLIFFLSAIVFCSLLWSGLADTWLSQLVFGGGCLVGLILVYVMANVYRLKTVPTWDSPITLFSFFKTTLLLGLVAASTLAQFVLIMTPIHDLTRVDMDIKIFSVWVIITVIVILSIDIVFKASRVSSKNTTRECNGKIVQIKKNIITKRILSFIGIIFFSIPIFLDSSISFMQMATVSLIGLAFVSFLISELIDRKLFYEFFKRAGI